MLMTDKKNRAYAYVSMDDVLSAIESCNELEVVTLRKLFNSFDYDNDKIRVPKNSVAYDILKRNKNIINGDTYINPTMLSEAFTRAAIEFNYEMRDRLFKYLKRYVDNMATNKDNEPLVQKILCDDKVMEYVHRYENFEDYTKHIIGTRIDKHKLKNKQKQKETNRSFVKIAA